MNLTSIAKKLAAGDLHYALGRFHSVRRAYSLANRLTGRGTPLNAASAGPSIFRIRDVAASVAALEQDAVAFGFDLPPEMVAALRSMAMTRPCIRSSDGRSFLWKDVRNGRLPDGQAVVLGSLPAKEIAEVQRIAADPILLAVIGAYLGYPPRRTAPWLFWSFATDVPDGERHRSNQTIDYHFDVHGYNFIYANFYLADVDSQSGAHAIIKASHRKKPLRMLLGSARRDRAALLAHYGAAAEFVIEGAAGLGFVEDASCFHRALPPAKRDRLMLQIRFV